MDKRTFIKGLALAGLGAPISSKLLLAETSSAKGSGRSLAEWVSRHADRPAATLAEDEAFWAGIRSGYRLTPDYINLENGYYCIQPEATLEAFIQHVRDVNHEGAHYMRTVQFDNKKALAARLAALAGCGADELIITRNTTESLDMIIAGYPWKEGDEAIMAEQDYPAMLRMFKQLEARQGVVRKVVSVPNHPSGDEEIVELYARAITPRTRLLMISHMINITGQILPVQKICDMAHAHGVEVMVDGAHAFAHIQYKISDLHCDYYGTSLHKWLSVPLGAGFLYVRKGLVPKIWPLFAEPDDTAAGIALLNHTGTLPVHTDLAIANALDYYQTLGAERKEARLHYLQTYWTSRVRGLKNVVVNTPVDPARSCGIANVGIKGMKPGVLAERLLKEYKIYTVAIDYPQANVLGCRITPNIFILPSELDVLVKALGEMGAVG